MAGNGQSQRVNTGFGYPNITGISRGLDIYQTPNINTYQGNNSFKPILGSNGMGGSNVIGAPPAPIINNPNQQPIPINPPNPLFPKMPNRLDPGAFNFRGR